MEYITVKEAAKKWKVSERLVQKYCSGGRIKGVRKFGSVWGIPADAPKPKDPRRSEKCIAKGKSQKADVCLDGLMPLMNTSFEPGCCREVIENMEDGPKKRIATAEYYYFSGHPQEAIQEAELYLTCPEIAFRLSACLIYGYANLSIGQIYQARHALTELKNIFASGKTQIPQIRAMEVFTATTAAVLLHLPLPEEYSLCQENLSLLPPGIRGFALYVRAHYYYLREEYEKSIGIIEASLAFQSELYPIPAIYMHLAAVMDYISLRQPEQAKAHLLEAWKIAKPDDLIEGFGEHHGLLGGMLEAVIKKEWPEDFKRIISITYQFSAGWRRIHNPDTGEEVADNLTTTEFTIAMLAARGWTNQEIADHLQVSVNTVKSCISTVLHKLNIQHRQELKRYMLR